MTFPVNFLNVLPTAICIMFFGSCSSKALETRKSDTCPIFHNLSQLTLTLWPCKLEYSLVIAETCSSRTQIKRGGGRQRRERRRRRRRRKRRRRRSAVHTTQFFFYIFTHFHNTVTSINAASAAVQQ